MAVTTFNIDKKLDQTLEELKKHYGATSKVEILRKAVALLKVAQDSEQDGALIIKKGDQETKVIVR